MNHLGRLATLTIVRLLLLACSGPITTEDWQHDLRAMHHELEREHVDLYHSVSREAFTAAVDDLERRIPTLSEAEILVAFAQLVAMVGDGHTSLFPGEQERWRFGVYPIRLWQFGDDIHVMAATVEHADLLGRRLLAIDGTRIDEAFERVRTTVGADNPMEYTYTVPFALRRPELLHALGIAKQANQAEFTFDGELRRTLIGETIKQSFRQDWRAANRLFGDEQPPSMRLEPLFATALTIGHLAERKYYWYEYLDSERTLFFQYNVCWDQKDRPSFEAVTAEMFEALDRGKADRLVINLRNNTGGEPMIAEPLIEGLAARPELGEKGRIFVLVGRRTYSAALTNAAQLRKRAGARIVGEPPRGKPNSPSEGRDIDLDRTGVWLTVSTQFVTRDPDLGDADFLPVDIPAAYTFDDYRAAEDPILAAALAAEIKP